MPGLSQLKKFNDDVLALGNEAELREQRGEKVVTVPIPNDVQDFDDSNDFMMGIADLIVDPTVANGSGNDENTSDATGSAIENQSISIPDLSSLIGESASDTASAGIPDLSMFMDDAPQAENPAPTPTQNANDFVDISLDELLGETSSDGSTGTTVNSPEPTDAEKIDDSALDISMSQNELPPIDETSADEPKEGEPILNELPNLDDGIAGTEDFSIRPSTDSGENANLPSDDFTLEDISGKSSQDDDFEIPDSSVEPTSSGSDVLSDLDLGASAEKNNTLPAGNLDDFTLEPLEEPAASGVNTIADTLDLPPLDDADSADRNTGDLELDTPDDFSVGSLNLDSDSDAPASDDVLSEASSLEAAPLDEAESAENSFGDLSFDDSDDFGAGSLDLGSDSDAPASDDALSEASSLEAAPLDEAESVENGFGDLSFDDSDDFDAGSLDFDSGSDTPASDDALSEASSHDAAPLDETESAENSFGDLSFDDSDAFDAGSLDLGSGSDAPASDDALSEASSLDAAPLDETENIENGFGDLSFDDSDDFDASSLDLDSDSDAPASDDALSEASSLDAVPLDDAERSENGFGDLSFDDSDDFDAGSLDLGSDSDAPASDDALPEAGSLDAAPLDETESAENGFGDLSFDDSDDFGSGSLDLGSGSDAPASDDVMSEAGSLAAAPLDEAESAESGFGDLSFDDSDDFGAGSLDLGSDSDTPASDDALSEASSLAAAPLDEAESSENGFGDLSFDDSDDFDAGSLDSGSDSGAPASDDALSEAGSPDTALPDEVASSENGFGDLSFDDSDDFGAGSLDLGSDIGAPASDDVLSNEGDTDAAHSHNEMAEDMSANFDVPAGEEANGFGDGIPEQFDTSEMAGMDFSDTALQSDNDSEFELDNDVSVKSDAIDFEIQGFTDVDTVAEGKNGKMKIPGAETEAASEESDLPPNTLSDADYAKFIDNLSSYPLNVRLAVEELIIKNEFTDEAEFEIVRKVLKKVSARQLASELEKMLDIAIPVPRDFERRTVAEYEAYKASFQYQLRNKIIPGALMSIIGVALAWLLFMFSRFFIFEPAMAAHLYKQGYTLLLADDYPQSEEKFTDAVKYNLQKKWFFKYARAYRDRKQYIRAEQMYKAILRAFKFDKEAGLEYARMELDELTNYEKAEEIALRDVLDHHINDPDGILLLGDIYLDWATEKDPSKFDFARERYSDLVQTNKTKKNHFLYLSRMLRYFIRTDNLLEVLRLKDQFMPKEKSLGAADWTELSGYLLDKLFGPLPPSDEYLRSKIEDAKKMLVRAVKADPANPVALYNMSRYYIHMHDRKNAKDSLMQTIRLFDDAPALKKRDIYKNIDSFRLLGEQYTDEREYIKALEAYTAGISLYSAQHEGSGLEGTNQIGKLYSDIGDIDFFISGDMDSALLNYKDAVDNFNDTAQIRYKIGYIQYGKKSYAEALGSFMKAAEDAPSDASLLLAMGNTLSMRDDNYAAEGYYERLIEYLDAVKAQRGVLFPQVRSDEEEIVDFYLKASNNLGVTLYRLARRTGNSDMNARAMVQFQQSLRAWDALTRNQVTMLRLGGSNLAEQNMKYVSHAMPDYEPAIYTDLPRTLSEEEEFGR